MIKQILSCILGLFLISSCATMTDVDMVTEQMKAETTIEVAKAEADKELYKAFGDSMRIFLQDPTVSEGMKGMTLSHMDNVVAEMRKQVASNVKKVRTGVDAQLGFFDTLVSISPHILLGFTLDKALDNQKTTTYNNDGDVIDSGNETENHATVAGDDNEVTSTLTEDNSEDNSTNTTNGI